MVTNESINTVDDFLAHHGIVGMKWGVRRYQREDGTRTPAGKKRERKAYSEDYQKMQEYKKRGKKNLSTKELQEYNTRKNLEKQFDKLSPTAYERGKTIAKSTLAVTAGVTTLYKFTTSDIGQKLIRKGKRFVSGSMRTIIAP